MLANISQINIIINIKMNIHLNIVLTNKLKFKVKVKVAKVMCYLEMDGCNNLNNKTRPFPTPCRYPIIFLESYGQIKLC